MDAEQFPPQLRFRMTCISCTAELLRDAIGRNGGRYDGLLVPNFQSISDLCAAPYQVLVEQVCAFPPLVEILKLVGAWPPPQGAN